MKRRIYLSLWGRDGINGRSAGLQHQVWLGWLRLTAPHPLARRFPSSSLPAHVRLLAAATSPPHPSSASGTSHRGMVLMCGSATEDALVEFIKEHAATISLFRVTTTIPVLQRVRHLLGRNGDAAVSALPPLCCLCPLSASLIASRARELLNNMSQVGVHENYLGGDAQVATQVVLHDVGALLSLLRPAATPREQVV